MKLTTMYACALAAVVIGATITSAHVAHSEMRTSKPVDSSSHKRVTHELITIGDSISAAFIGYTATKPSADLQMLGHDTQPGEVAPPHVKNGVRYPAALESKDAYSWATGQKIDSIAKRLEAWLYLKDTKNKLGWMNLSESGALTEHMPRQARWAMEDFAKENQDGQIALITLMIGSNDACARLESTPEEAAKIRADLKSTFDRLSAGIPSRQTAPVPVSVSSVPKIYELGSSEIRSYPVNDRMTCADVRRDVRDSCPLLSNWKTQDEFEVRKSRVEWVNNVLRTAVAEMTPSYPKLSVAWDNQLAEYTLQGPDLAADCFHPGKRGQAKLADMLWSQMPWFK